MLAEPPPEVVEPPLEDPVVEPEPLEVVPVEAASSSLSLVTLSLLAVPERSSPSGDGVPVVLGIDSAAPGVLDVFSVSEDAPGVGVPVIDARSASAASWSAAFAPVATVAASKSPPQLAEPTTKSAPIAPNPKERTKKFRLCRVTDGPDPTVAREVWLITQGILVQQIDSRGAPGDPIVLC